MLDPFSEAQLLAHQDIILEELDDLLTQNKWREIDDILNQHFKSSVELQICVLAMVVPAKDMLENYQQLKHFCKLNVLAADDDPDYVLGGL